VINENGIDLEIKNDSEEEFQDETQETEINEAEEPLSPEEEIESLKQALADKQDNLFRLSAEFENYKKRLDKDKDNICKFANESLIKDLIPVIDNLDLAMQHAEDNADFNTLKEGIAITLKEFLSILDKNGLTQLDAQGEIFDPNLHEAVSQEETKDVPPNTVVRELKKGYLLKERLLRPSMVIVSKG